MLSRKIAFFVIALAVMACAGCNDVSVTSTPDTTPPLPPQMVDALTKDVGRVVLSWTPNQEADLAGYNVYQLAPFRQINPTLLRDPMFVLHLSESDVPYFRVTAIDRSGNESAPSRIARVRTSAQGADDGLPGREWNQKP